MKIPFITERRERKHYHKMAELELARHKRMMELISEASKRGMRN